MPIYKTKYIATSIGLFSMIAFFCHEIDVLRKREMKKTGELSENIFNVYIIYSFEFLD